MAVEDSDQANHSHAADEKKVTPIAVPSRGQGSSPERNPEEPVEMRESDADQDNENGDLSPASSALYPPPSKNVLSFEKDDPGSPYNWSHTWRAVVVAMGVICVLNSTIGSSLPSGNIDPIAAHFEVTNQEQLVLPISIFLVGYVLGPLLFGPMSEAYGRQWVMWGTFAGFTVFAIVICFSPNYAAFIVFRLFGGTFASAPIAIVGGQYADLYDSPVHRGRAMALFMAATSWGPLIGPIASGYLSVYSWRWPFWFSLIVAGGSWIILVFMPETFGPEILARRARKIRKETGQSAVFAPIELEQTNFKEVVAKVLMRPFRMFFTEPLVLFSCLFLCLIYGIYYIFFQVFPVIYPPLYGFSPGQYGLAFLPIGLGTIIACAIYLWWDHYLYKAKERGAAWASSEEYRRLPLGCIGGPFFCIGMFWIGWAAQRSVHWIVPILGGVPLGIGFLLLFMSLINYIVDAYEIYAASAMAAASCSRSIFGAVLPFAGKKMFQTLGIAWACSLMGFLSLSMCVIPFIFLKYGHKIRARSKFCQQLMEEKKRRAEEEEYRRKRNAYWEERRRSEKTNNDEEHV